MKSFKITYKDFMRGQNSYEDYPDGGIVTSAIGANPFSRRAWLQNAPDQAQVTDIPGVGQSIAYAQGPASANFVSLGRTTGGNGKFYSINTSTGVYTLVASDTTKTYSKTNSDATYYAGKYYFTSESNVTQTDLALGSLDPVWWTTTQAQPAFADTKHPVVVYGAILYIGDGKYIHQYDNYDQGIGGPLAQSQVLDLEDGYVIDNMVVYNNLIFIAAHLGNGFSKIYTWDGFSPSWIDEYDANDLITSMFVFQGILFVFMPNAVCYFDGTKIKEIREISGSVYKHMVTKSRTSMYLIEVIDSTHSCITRYSPVVFQGKQANVWYRYLDQSIANGLYDTCIIGASQSLFSASNASTARKSSFIDGSNINDRSTTKNNIFTFNQRTFSVQVNVRSIVAEFDDISTGTNEIDLAWIDDKETSHSVGSITGVNTEEHNRQMFDSFEQPLSRIVQLVATIKKSARLKSIEVFYEPSELPVNS